MKAFLNWCITLNEGGAILIAAAILGTIIGTSEFILYRIRRKERKNLN